LSGVAREDLRAKLSGIYPILSDVVGTRHGWREVLEGVLRAGARVVQLRLKQASDRDVLASARWAVERAHAAGALLILNDRFDLALLAGADGVHLGDDDLAVERLPEDARGDLVVGLSTHTLEQVEASRSRPVDYIGFGPIFATGSKRSEYTPRGLDDLARAAARATVPVVAIGGIELERVAAVRRAGATSVAVVGALANAADPQEAARRLVGEYEGARA